MFTEDYHFSVNSINKHVRWHAFLVSFAYIFDNEIYKEETERQIFNKSLAKLS